MNQYSFPDSLRVSGQVKDRVASRMSHMSHVFLSVQEVIARILQTDPSPGSHGLDS